MEEPWNQHDLQPPPFVTIPCARNDIPTVLLKCAASSANDVQATIQDLTDSPNKRQLNSEVLLISRMIYRCTNNLGGHKAIQGLQKVKKCLERLQNIDLEGLLKPLGEELDMLAAVLTSRSVYIQSSACLKYLLNRLMGTSALLGQAALFCMHTFIHAYEELSIGNFIPNMLVFMALMSRVRVLCLHMLGQLIQCYNHAYGLLLHVYGVQAEEKLPEDLDTWLKDQGYSTSVAPHLDRKMEKSSQDLDDLLSKYCSKPESSSETMDSQDCADTDASGLKDTDIEGDDTRIYESPNHSEDVGVELKRSESSSSDDDSSYPDARLKRAAVAKKAAKSADNLIKTELKARVKQIKVATGDISKCKSAVEILNLLKTLHSTSCVPKQTHQEYVSLKNQLKIVLQNPKSKKNLKASVGIKKAIKTFLMVSCQIWKLESKQVMKPIEGHDKIELMKANEEPTNAKIHKSKRSVKSLATSTLPSPESISACQKPEKLLILLKQIQKMTSMESKDRKYLKKLKRRVIATMNAENKVSQEKIEIFWEATKDSVGDFLQRLKI